MQDENIKHWLDQLEVTGPIKGIMDFVDELSRNYDRRLAAMHIEYQKDVEEILDCYKNEKQEFSTQLAEQKEIITSLENELKNLQQSYKTINVEYKLAKDSLETARTELAELTKALKKEEDLLALTKERIESANAQIRMELAARGISPSEPAPTATEISTAPSSDLEPVVRPKRGHLRRTREFFQQIVADRLTRPIILRPKKTPIVTEKFNDQDAF